MPARGEVNCSHCEKCLRTMAEIRCAGAEAHARTFQWPLDLGKIRRIKLDDVHRFLWVQIREAALRRGDRELARAVEAALGPRFRLEQLWSRSLRERRNHIAARKNWKELSRKMKPPEGRSGEVPSPRELLAEIQQPIEGSAMREVAADEDP
jgi:hypothetical protein